MSEIPHTDVPVGPYSTEYKALAHYGGKHVAEQVIALPSMAIPPNLIYEYMETSSGSTGGIEMNTSGNTTAPYEYFYTVTSGHTGVIKMLHATILDGGITPSKFGGIAALTNGLKVEAYGSTGNELGNLTVEAIKRNGDFAVYGEAHYAIVAGDDSFNAALDFIDHTAAIFMTSGQYIKATVQDNLKALTQFRVMVHGIQHDTTP